MDQVTTGADSAKSQRDEERAWEQQRVKTLETWQRAREAEERARKEHEVLRSKESELKLKAAQQDLQKAGKGVEKHVEGQQVRIAQMSSRWSTQRLEADRASDLEAREIKATRTEQQKKDAQRSGGESAKQRDAERHFDRLYEQNREALKKAYEDAQKEVVELKKEDAEGKNPEIQMKLRAAQSRAELHQESIKNLDQVFKAQADRTAARQQEAGKAKEPEARKAEKAETSKDAPKIGSEASKGSQKLMAEGPSPVQARAMSRLEQEQAKVQATDFKALDQTKAKAHLESPKAHETKNFREEIKPEAAEKGRASMEGAEKAQEKKPEKEQDKQQEKQRDDRERGR